MRCLDSLAGQVDHLVYVDSGSKDSSVHEAASRGALVVELDPSRPFTAARARHAGVVALGETDAAFLQFVDGDCSVDKAWVTEAVKAMKADPALGLVTGWRSEVDPDRSVFNALCDYEWHRPAGEIVACGGDMMVRRAAYDEAGGFNARVIAAEDDEFCLRLGKAGWKLVRLALPMTTHDANMTRFSQWWRRAVRSGHGFAQVGHLHPGYFAAEKRRVWTYGVIFPAVMVALLILWPAALILIFAAYLLSYLKTAKGLRQGGLRGATVWKQSFFLSLSKVPNAIGMGIFHWRRAFGKNMEIIEYK